MLAEKSRASTNNKKEAGLKFCERGPREAEQIVQQKGAKDQKRYNDDDGCDGMDRREPC